MIGSYPARRVFAGGVLLAVAAAAPLQGQQHSPTHRVLVAEKHAYMVMPAQVAAGAIVERAGWSPDGQYVVADRQEVHLTEASFAEFAKPNPGRPQVPPGFHALTLWSKKTGRYADVWRSPLDVGQVESFHWLNGSAVALVVVRESPRPTPAAPQPQAIRRLLRLDAATGRLRQLLQASTDVMLEIRPSPVSPQALLWRTEFVKELRTARDGKQYEARQPSVRLQMVRVDGTLSQPVAPPPGTFSQFNHWREDGRELYLHSVTPSKERGKPAVFRWYSLDPRQLRVTELPGEPPAPTPPSEPERPFRISTGKPAVLEGEVKQPVFPVWLESKVKTEQPRILVAADAQQPQLSPAGDSILYLSQGSAMVAPLVRIDRELFAQMRRAASRSVTMSRAKQLGTGLLMYAQDYDETFPTPDGINDKLSPYLKNLELFEGFTYTYPGGKLADIPEPAKTEVGYVTFESGRAVLFADGHVVWQDGQQ